RGARISARARVEDEPRNLSGTHPATCRTTRQPREPLAGHDADDVGPALAARDGPLLHADEAEYLRQLDRVPGRRPADSGLCRPRIVAIVAEALRDVIQRQVRQDCLPALREMLPDLRGQMVRTAQTAPPGDGLRAIRGALMPARQESLMPA